MSYFPDLSPYCYHVQKINPNVLSIGWLDKSHTFRQGSTSEELLKRLWMFCQWPVQKARGFYDCELCEEATSPLIVRREDVEIRLGAAELRIPGKNNIIYAAPDLIYHYVTVHEYTPPDEFVEAVLLAPLPNSPDYIQFLDEHDIDYIFRNNEGEVIAAGGAYTFLQDKE